MADVTDSVAHVTCREVGWEEHRLFLERQEVGAIAEAYGFRASRLFPVPGRYSSDPYKQRRYEQGFRDGQAKLVEEGQS